LGPSFLRALDGLFGLGFLDNADHGVDHHHDKDDDIVGKLSQDDRYGGRGRRMYIRKS
jgi:hypothetical protein